MRRSDIEIRLRCLQDKYFDLVWFARHRPNEEVGPPGVEAAAKIWRKWEAECTKLTADTTNWEHGFNSGCLAAFRLALGLMGNATDVQMAEDDFPFLDT
jgi:hypothetical protein